MQQIGNKDRTRQRKAYLVYKLDTDVQVEMICNPNTELEHRSIAKCVYQYEYNPSTYVFSVDLPNFNLLRERNTIIFEITYCPKQMIAVSYYSERFTISLNDDLTYYFMPGLKFRRNERNMFYKEPPGEPVDNQVQEMLVFYYFIFSTYIFLHDKFLKTGRFSEVKNVLSTTFNQLSDLINSFKVTSGSSNGVLSFISNPKFISDYLTLIDDFILSHIKLKQNPEICLFLIPLFGVFPYDYFTSREFTSKNASLLLNNAVNALPDNLALVQPNLRPILANGYYVLINMAVKEGNGTWVNMIKNNLLGFVFETENEFYTRVSEFIRRCGISMKDRENFQDAKKLLLEYYYDKNSQERENSKFINAVIRNIGIISMNKENLVEIIFEFYEEKILDVEKIKLMKEEIKRKKWELDNEENFRKYIQKLNLIIELPNNIIGMKEEFKNILYEMSNSVKYLFTLLRSNFTNEKIEVGLLKKAFSSIYEMSLDDYAIIISGLKRLPNEIKKELIDSLFYDKIKQTLKKVVLPFEESPRHLLKILLLNEELFPNGSLDLIKDFLRNKPSLEDLIFLTRDLIYPQRKLNTKKKFIDIFLSIRNHLVNSFVDISELVKNFSLLISKLCDALTTNNNNFSEQVEDEEFKNWYCDEIWKTVYQKYSNEVFINVSSLFTETSDTNTVVIKSYLKHINNSIDLIPLESGLMYDKINSFFSALSVQSVINLNNQEPIYEKVLHSNNSTTESIIISLLDFLLKNSDPTKLSKNFIYENPSREAFWYKLIKSNGKSTSNFSNHPYLTNIINIIHNMSLDVINGKASIIDFILISKQITTQREAMISYFAKISEGKESAFEINLLEKILENKLEILKENLKIITDLETFFNNYGHYIKDSESYVDYIRSVRQNFTMTEFNSFNIRDDLIEIRKKIQIVNKWSETVMFRNIFDMEYLLNDTTLKGDKYPIDKVLQICLTSEEQIKHTLTSILLKEDFSHLSLSLTKRYFKGLEDYIKESNIIDEMINLELTQKQTLISILKTFCEINNFIRFSHSLIKLDSIYFFSKSNKNIYLEFLELINNTDSSFDKIFTLSKRLADIRSKYLAKRDIENILFELSEDKDLSHFLLYTPEEDIRNMVDAVDEHGDSFIRVQTIRDLLIIGSFIKSMNLKDFPADVLSNLNNPSEEEFIDRIHNAFKRSPYNGIDVLMNSCMKQFTGIKHLHNELSNREEASKIKAKEVSKNSTFEYVFNEKAYQVSIKYGKTNKRINYRDLGDLRDRVLLLIYNEKDKDGEDRVEENDDINDDMINENENELITTDTKKYERNILLSFIKIVELTERILFILNDIYHNGYPGKLSRSIKMEEGDFSKFDEYLNEISDISTKWNEDLKEAYVKYYPLTYFHGNQFWELESLFENIKTKPESDCEKLPGFYLLKYADPSLKISEIMNCITTANNRNAVSNDEIVIVDKRDITRDTTKDSAKERILNLGELISLIILPSRNGSKIIPNLRKVNLNLKGGHIIYSSPSNLRIYTYLLSIHFSIDNSLPSSNALFYCRRDTTFHELIAFLYRFIHSPVPRLFSIIRLENLTFELQNFLAEQINKLSKNKSQVAFLQLICCDPNSFLHTGFLDNLSIYLMRDFDILDEMLISTTLRTLDLNAYVVRSDDTGAGKTHYIRSKVKEEKMSYIDFPIMDSIDINRINERLYKLNTLESKLKFLHITINGVIDDFEMLDYILFSLVIIGCVKHEIYASFRLTENPVYIEIANTYNDHLYNTISILPLLPFQEMIIAEDNFQNLTSKDMKDIKDPVQIVANYLFNFDKEYLNDTDIVPDIGMNTKIFSKDDCLAYISKYFIKGSHNVTFRQVQIFLSVLSDQLVKYSNNFFFSCENLGYINDDNLKDIRQRIMQCLLIMTEEFTTRSIRAARDSQNQTVFKLKRSFSREEIHDEDKRIEEINSLSNILSWSSSNHLIIMFHEDGMCVTPVYREASKVNEAVRELVESQRQSLEDYHVYSHFELLEKLVNIVGRSFDLDVLAKKQDYILTADNFLKMLLIIIRARCNVPIVIMGETGCGKTSLVRFLATEIMQEGFEVINFHAGFKEQHILERMNEVISRAEMLKVTDNKVWIFLDEINTCDCMGLITEIICQKTMLGQSLPDNIIFIAACNPYKIRRNHNNDVGLIKQRVATRLVYTVHPLPDALIDYVWDYGSLTESEERLYIGNILCHISGEIKKISIEAVCRSQIFIRKCEDKFSVSLRDVTRFKILHEWFHKVLIEKNEERKAGHKDKSVDKFNDHKYSHTNIKYTGELMISRKALILSVILCYYNRISKNNDRVEYKKEISQLAGITEEELDEMINEEQRDLVTRMELPPAIAINKALLENVFTLMVCVINKIPLFICGKPGCSKSLSVQLLVSNLRGADSHDNFFKKLPRILAIPYQGSESSTSEGIAKIFEKAHNVLNSHDNSILPLIVFDEIGLAEISKNNPLKILHSLLEPEKAEIAFVGISNWRLDASKMNRAVYLARPDPDLEDLENTALSIFEYYIKQPKFDEKMLMKALAKTYFEFKTEQSMRGYADFHGTRDFYSLIKGVTREFNSHYNNYNELKFNIVRDALCRNFGGLPNSSSNILDIFAKNMNLENLSAKNTIMDLVKDNLLDRDSRFLLLFTNGESASYILDNYLKADLKDSVFMIGSEFELDKDKDEHSFRLLSDITLFMESGSSIIMKNLDQIYGSLYDLFNQNFMIVGQKKNCRIALGSTNNPMCFVKDSFHCVVLVDIKDLNRMDPPFLNRFEKQILTFESVLNTRQKIIVDEVEKWIKALTTIYKEKDGLSLGRMQSNISNSGNTNNNIEMTNIETSEMIITYNEEFTPSLVLTHFNKENTNEGIIEKCKNDILSVSSISLIVYSVLSNMYGSARDEVTKAHRIYFEEQNHDSLNQYLIGSKNKTSSLSSSKLIVYTYSNILDEVNLAYLTNTTSAYTLNIAEIKSEKEFDLRFKGFLNNESNSLMLIKFDVVKEQNHISMIKFKIDKMLAEYKKIRPDVEKNVIMVIYLSRKGRESTNANANQFGNGKKDQSSAQLESHFLSGWSQIMIDCLNGGQIDEMKNLLDLTTLQIVKKNLDQKWIAEIIFNIYLKFSFATFNPADMSLVKLYMTESIHKIESDRDIFEIILKKCLEFLEDKDLGDWKVKICCDGKILAKSLNTFSAIKSVIEGVIEEPLLRIIHYLETESSLNSYFYTQNLDKVTIFKKIWKEQFDKKDLNDIYTYNVTGSLNVSCVFNLLFPFSKRDVYEISHALKEHIEKIRMYDNAAYNYNYIADTDDKDERIIHPELKINFDNELEKIKKITKSSVLFKILSNSEYSERALETAYISDVCTLFLLVEIKKQYKWKNCLDIIVHKCIGFDIENLEHIYIFLWGNSKILDSIFNVFNALCSEASAGHSLFETSFIENILSDDKLYDSRLINSLSDLKIRKESQINTFSNIFNTLSKILLSQLKNIKANINIYGIILNVFISSLMNFSLEIKNVPDAFNILIVVNEFLKILSALFKNDKEEISKRVQGIFMEYVDEGEFSYQKENLINRSLNNQNTNTGMIIEEEMINTSMSMNVNFNQNNNSSIIKPHSDLLNYDNKNYDINSELSVEMEMNEQNKENIKYDHISLKDFQVLQNILIIIDKEIEELRIRSLNPDNFIKQSFIDSMQANTISGKLAMFENVIIAKCDFNTKIMIIHNILKDDDLCKHSSMIFYHLYTSQSNDRPNNNKDESLTQILSSPLSNLINDYLTRNNISFNSVICSFFSDFFRKFLSTPTKEQTTTYLIQNLQNYENFLKLCQDKDSITKYEQLVGFAGVKHYLDIYGRHLADESIVKDKELLSLVNKTLESQELFIEVLRNFTLKSMASYFGGTANTLVNVNYEEMEIHWVNNKLFENNDNALGIEPNLPEFEKINKEYSLFFVSLLNEDNEENILKLKNMILNSKSKPEIKFILIQFFINKTWLSFTHPKYITSYTYQFTIKLFDRVKDDIKESLGITIHNLIYNLVNNFPKNKNLCISPTTDTNRIGMFTLAMQIMNMLLSFGREVCLGKLYFNEKNELYKSLNHLTSIFLPGGFVEYQDENLLVMMKHIDENYEIYGTQIGLYECECGFLYTIGDCTRPYYVSQCPNCTKQIGGTGHVLMSGHKNLINADNRNENNRKQWVINYLGTKLKNNPGYVSKMADELSMHYSIRGLSSIGFRFLNFFNHSVIYLLTELGAIEENTLSNIINIRGINIVPKDYLLKHMLTDITKLTELIKSKEWYIFMHVVFNEFLALNKDPFKFDSAIEREKFEIAFQTKIIAPKLDKLAGEITEYKMFFNNDKKLNYLSIINENFCEDEIKSLSNYELFRIFRFTRLGYWDDLKSEFMKKKVPYQLLKLLIEKFDDVTNLSECLYPLIQFSNYMLNQCNFRFTRAESKEKRIREVIESNPTAERLFVDFAVAWKRIAYKCTQWQCKSLPVLDKVDLDLPLSFILVDDREMGYGMYMAAAFQYLGRIQNEVLEAIVYLIKENNNYQIWGNMDTLKYPIQKISPHEITMYQTDKDYIKVLTETFSKFYDVFNSNYGQGGIVEYNFEKIEGELAFKLLTNKKFLDFENLEKIQYKFELLSIQGRHSNLLADIKSKVDQLNLNEDDYKEVSKYLDKIDKQNVAYLNEIFSSLEIILCNLRYQGIVDNTTIANYIGKMPGNEKITSILKVNEPVCLIKLCSIISFYQLVEEKLFKYLVDFISPEYNQPMDEKIKKDVFTFINKAENESGKYPSSRVLLNVIRRFITRCLVATIEPKFPIKEYLMRVDFWNIDSKEDEIDNFYFEFPDDILIANTISLYEFITDYLELKNEKGWDIIDITEDQNKLDAMRQDLFKKQNKFI